MALLEDLPEGTDKKIQAFEQNLDKIEGAWKLMKRLDLTTAKAQLAPLENARLNFTLAYCLNSLFHMYLQTQGVTPDSHPVKAELARIQQQYKKIDKAAHPEKYKPKMKLDQGAADRFIKGSLSKAQRQGKNGKKRKKDSKNAEPGMKKERKKSKSKEKKKTSKQTKKKKKKGSD